MLLEGNRLAGIADTDLEPRTARGDRQVLIAELTDDVERLARRLFEREAQRVRRDLALDLGADVRRCAEVPVGRHRAVERLMRSLEVVVLEEVLEPVLSVDVVGKHSATEKLVPQRLPEAFDLAERLRMLRPAADVPDAEPLECDLEFRLAAPHGVLPPVVGQHLRRLTERGDAALERLHHQRRLLVVRERVPDDEATVVIHEHADVEPLLPSVQEGEDVGLPQLIRRRALEATRLMLPLRRRRRALDQPFLVQDPPHLLFRDTECLEPLQHVSNPPRPPVLVLLLEFDDSFPLRRRARRLFPLPSPLRQQPICPVLPELPHPLGDRSLRHPERLRDVALWCPVQALVDCPQFQLHRHLSAGSPFRSDPHAVSCSADSVSAVCRRQC